MKETTIRSARIGEVNILLDLWRDADAEPSVSDDVDSVSRLLAQHPDGVLVAEVDGVVVGALIAVWDGWRGNLYRLAVLPAHRRLGIARALVDEGEQRLRRAGCVRVTALVMHEHAWATSFWSAAGYDHDRRVIRFVGNLRESSRRARQAPGPPT